MSVGYGKNWDPSEHYQATEVAVDYDRKRFASLAGRAYNWLEKRLVRRAFADLPKAAALADIPCGTGRLAEVLLESGFHVTGIDIAPPMLEVAQRRLQRFAHQFEAKTLDAKQLPASGLQFDAALCARVLMHFTLAEQIIFLRSVAEVTRRRVVFTQGLDTPYQRLRRRLKRLLRHQSPAVYPLTPNDLHTLIECAGLREIRRCRLLPLLSEAVLVITEPVHRLGGRT